MNNGDDIHNLLKTLGHDAGLYQDLAKYNASRAALRRAAMVRPAGSAAAAPATPPPAAPMPVPMSVPMPVSMAEQPVAPARGESPSLSAILHRLSSPTEAPSAHGRGHDATNGGPASLEPSARQPTRLDRLFGRLSGR
jgi:hypothetical protein